jgi:hypothetical protein
MKQKKVGWNYENLILTGKNLFIYRDTNHINQTVQDTLLQNIEDKIGKEFKVIFSEGFEGPLFEELEQYRECVSEILDQKPIKGLNLTAIERLAYKESNNLLKIYGADNEVLLKEHKIALQNRFQSYEEDDITAILLYNQIQLDISKERSRFAVNYVINSMTELNLKSSALIFGEGHYTEIANQLNLKGVGYASFLPEVKVLSQEEIHERNRVYLKSLK